MPFRRVLDIRPFENERERYQNGWRRTWQGRAWEMENGKWNMQKPFRRLLDVWLVENESEACRKPLAAEMARAGMAVGFSIFHFPFPISHFPFPIRRPRSASSLRSGGACA